MRIKVLWIEDQANEAFAEYAACVHATGRYDLVVAGDATEAIRLLLRTEFDVVVVDVRIPPGSDPKWIALYNGRGKTKVSARLGLAVLGAVLLPDQSPVKIDGAGTGWMRQDRNRFGLLSVEGETEVSAELRRLGVSMYRQKRVESPSTVLLELIEEIHANWRRGEEANSATAD